MRSEQHHLIAHPGATFVPRELAGAFAPLLRRTALDEALRLRYCGGWLIRDSDEETVAALRAAVDQVGIAASTVVTESPIEPAAIERVLSVSLDGDRMQVPFPECAETN